MSADCISTSIVPDNLLHIVNAWAAACTTFFIHFSGNSDDMPCTNAEKAYLRCVEILPCPAGSGQVHLKKRGSSRPKLSQLQSNFNSMGLGSPDMGEQ